MALRRPELPNVHDVTVKVRSQRTLGPDTFLLVLEGPRISREAHPGQFVMLRTSPAAEPLLRRPMSFCQAGSARHPRSDSDTFQVLYQVVGSGTRLLAGLSPGDSLSCLGPLGRGFRLPEPGSGPSILVAGGIGIAPFPFLAEALARKGGDWKLVYGARHAGLLVGVDWFRRLGGETVLATEDGSRGTRGLVTGPLGEILAAAGDRAQVYACGPDPMLRAVSRICEDLGVACQLSLETVMPCGFGVCLGCSVPAAGTANRYLRVCTEGPVFDRREIRW